MPQRCWSGPSGDARSQGFSCATASRRPGRGLAAASSRIIEQIGARILRAFVLYLAKPVDALATLTRSDLQTLAEVLDRGDVLLSAGNTRCAALVERVTRSTWSHVSMYVGPLDDASDPLCIIEADIASGVRRIRLSQLGARRVCVLRATGLDDSERRQLADTVVSRVGSEYDLRHAWVLARNLAGRRRRARSASIPSTKGKGVTRFICSSLIAQAFAMIGHSLLPVQSPRECAGVADHAHLTPADFERSSAFEIVWRVTT
jgi:hypothetical protein